MRCYGADATGTTATGRDDMTATAATADHHLRHLRSATHLARPFGADGFGRRAEAFARFFGTPTFIALQTAVVVAWIVLNAAHVISWDIYPFILLNLGFSLQAAYAAPLILLAQTRQADRDKAHAEADAAHREEIAQTSLHRQQLMEEQTRILGDLLRRNTELTELNQALTESVQALTREIHQNVCPRPRPA